MTNAINQLQVRAEVIEEIKKSLSAKNRLQYELRKSYKTIQKWLSENSDKLTTAQALKIISEELGKSRDELLTEA